MKKEPRGYKIQMRRIELGMTQDQLAAAVGTCRTMICGYECDKHAPKRDMLERIAKALKCDVIDLIDDETADFMRRLRPSANGMTFAYYQLNQRQTENTNQLQQMCLAEAAMGLAGETGEVVDIIKKHVSQGHELDREHLTEELGDVMWYLSYACGLIGVTMEQVAQRNIDKLKKRYPDGFASDKSINR